MLINKTQKIKSKRINDYLKTRYKKTSTSEEFKTRGQQVTYN